jgi:hypothetical protein
MRRFALAFVLLSGCAGYGYIGTGPAPRVTVVRPVSLTIDVTGSGREMVDEALGWLLHDNSQLVRTRGSADGNFVLEAKLDRSVAIIAGTDVTLRLHLQGRGLDERRELARTGLTSGVPTEVEKLATEGATWALERAAAVAAGQPTPVASAPEAVTAPTAPEQPAPVSDSSKKRRRNR